MKNERDVKHDVFTVFENGACHPGSEQYRRRKSLDSSMFLEEFGITYEPGSRIWQSSSKDQDEVSDRSEENQKVRRKKVTIREEEDDRVTINQSTSQSSRDIRRAEPERPCEFERQLQFDAMHDQVGASGNAQQVEQDHRNRLDLVDDMILPEGATPEDMWRGNARSAYMRGPAPTTGKGKKGIFSGEPTSPLFGPSPEEVSDIWDPPEPRDRPPIFGPEQLDHHLRRDRSPEPSGPYTDAPAAPRSPSTSSSYNNDTTWARDFGSLIRGPRRRRPSDAPRQGWDDSDWADDATNNYIDNHGQEVEVAAPPRGWSQGWQDRWWDWNTSKSWWN
jgi:hypothetical protein